jgi:hypothetical protein
MDNSTFFIFGMLAGIVYWEVIGILGTLIASIIFPNHRPR